jgi:hypothetical protein
MKIVGTVLIIAGVIAVLVPRLYVSLPEGVSLPTRPTDILGGLLLLAGFIATVLPEKKK